MSCRKECLVNACLAAKQRFVVDNTNPTREDRRRYIEPAKAAGFKVIGYYFHSEVEACEERNRRRPKKQVVPLQGILAAHDRLEVPGLDEGFDRLYHVRISEDNGFVVEAVKCPKP